MFHHLLISIKVDIFKKNIFSKSFITYKNKNEVFINVLSFGDVKLQHSRIHSVFGYCGLHKFIKKKAVCTTCTVSLICTSPCPWYKSPNAPKMYWGFCIVLEGQVYHVQVEAVLERKGCPLEWSHSGGR